MVFIDFFTEGMSEKVVLDNLLPKLIKYDEFRVINFNGKYDLLSHLPKKLRAYSYPPLNLHKIVILIDRDYEDCHQTKEKLEQIVRSAGLISKTVSPNDYQVITRVAIEELESWYFGDVFALHSGYQSIPMSLNKKTKYSNPDAISKPSLQLSHLLKKEFGNTEYISKIDIAFTVSKYMSWDSNTSESFQYFYSGIKDILSRAKI